MKTKTKNYLFICQFSDDAIKLIKCLSDNSRMQFTTLEVEKLPANIEDKALIDKVSGIFKKLAYNQNRVIVSLPRSKIAARSLKVPTQVPGEIENIISLQASRYLPYPAEELITGYQVISRDPDGYSHINLIIVRKDVVERYFRILKEIKCSEIEVILNCYGLGNLCDFIYPDMPETAMILDIDYLQVEAAIFHRGKLLFSRYFKLDSSQPNWEDVFNDEILKTRDVYLKEQESQPIHKIILTGAVNKHREITQLLQKLHPDTEIRELDYRKINFSSDLLNTILASENSFAGMLGLGLKNVDGNLNLLPRELKEKNRLRIEYKQRLQLIMLSSVLLLVLSLAAMKNLDNKSAYLKQLKLELNKIGVEARSLEQIDKRLQLMRQRSGKELSSLDLIYQLYQAIPDNISLTSLNYDENNQITLRGNTSELNYVFAFVARLEKSAAFRDFSIKVRYATQKKTQTGVIVDFEIICAKK